MQVRNRGRPSSARSTPRDRDMRASLTTLPLRATQRPSSSAGGRSRLRRTELPLATEHQHQASPAQLEDEQLEKEYISNLQQQIYFLELENQMVKEKPRSGGGAVGPHMSGSDPLASHMAGFREKFAAMEKDFKAQIEALTDEKKVTRKENKKQRKLIDRLIERNAQRDSKIDEYEKGYDVVQAKHLEEKIKLEKTVNRLEEQLEERLATHNEYAEKVREQRIAQTMKIDELQLDLTKAQAEVLKATDRLQVEADETDAAKCEVLELQEQMKQGIEDRKRLREDNRNLQSTNRELESSVRKYTIDLKRVKETVAKQDEDMTEITQERDDFENQLVSERKKMHDLLSGGETWSTELVHLRRNSDALKRDAEAAKVTIRDHERQYTSLREDLARSVDKNADQSSQRMQMLSELEKLQARFDACDEENNRVLRDNIQFDEQNSQVIDANAKLDKQIQEVTQDRDSLRVELAALKEKLALCEDVESLKLHDFTELMNTNASLSGKIQSLVGRLQNHRGGGMQASPSNQSLLNASQSNHQLLPFSQTQYSAPLPQQQQQYFAQTQPPPQQQPQQPVPAFQAQTLPPVLARPSNSRHSSLGHSVRPASPSRSRSRPISRSGGVSSPARSHHSVRSTLELEPETVVDQSPQEPEIVEVPAAIPVPQLPAEIEA